jgi:hypothetical protein
MIRARGDDRFTVGKGDLELTEPGEGPTRSDKFVYGEGDLELVKRGTGPKVGDTVVDPSEDCQLRPTARSSR